tara:strand:- start:63 stop:986 length:924 start_codon:yes stop_codon:yes gene_type:complete
MNFYGKNAQQDRYFVEIRNCLELIYWVAADIDHFVESKPELIDKKVLEIIFQNSTQLKNFYSETEEKINVLKGPHKECALVLADYIKSCIEEFDFIQNKDREEESDDVKYSRMFDADINFRDKFDKYFLKTDVELYRLRAFKHFTLALSSLIDFTAFIGNNSELSLAENKRAQAIKHICDAEAILKIGCRFMERNDASTRDFFIAYSGNTQFSAQQYYQYQVEFNSILQELFFIQRNFYSQFDNDQMPEDTEFKLVDFETEKYYGQLNQIGFEISKIILAAMNKDIPNFILLSPLANKNQLDFIKVK